MDVRERRDFSCGSFFDSARRVNFAYKEEMPCLK